MDAPGKECFNSPLSRRQNPDHRPRKGGWPDEGSCRVFPGKCRIIRDLTCCKSPPRSVKFGASSNKVDSEGQVVKARRTYKDGEKARSSCCVFPGKRYIILFTANPRPVLRNATPVASKAKRYGSFQDPVCSSCVCGLPNLVTSSLEDFPPAQRQTEDTQWAR